MEGTWCLPPAAPTIYAPLIMESLGLSLAHSYLDQFWPVGCEWQHHERLTFREIALKGADEPFLPLSSSGVWIPSGWDVDKMTGAGAVLLDHAVI